VSEVTQTAFGFPDQAEPAGDCFPACIASLLERPLSDVPRVRCPQDMTGWLRAIGLLAITFRCDPDRNDPVPEGLHIVAGQSPRRPDRRDMLHSVVARGREVVWDPHPSRAGLLNWQESTLLVQLDPARCRAAEAERDAMRAVVAAAGVLTDIYPLPVDPSDADLRAERVALDAVFESIDAYRARKETP